ncbi:hypothetical protein ACFFX0_10360 [Citricoccus parietis]|uniref:Uncharacterized protein n=1 Tax=Citricoccus parietis TaxID=592307 RepID=A0ABV5FY17_9MICC
MTTLPWAAVHLPGRRPPTGRRGPGPRASRRRRAAGVVMMAGLKAVLKDDVTVEASGCAWAVPQC